mmetsp:Transcript_15399/g.47677  ORF Transcript_15399/g.47677 Transcript_15399/m.47677 type:complete len:107 (-) Transcript_15399:23-343(-)
MRRTATTRRAVAALAAAAAAETYFGELEYVLDAAAVRGPAPCPLCDGTEVVPCPNCDGVGSYVAMGGVKTTCTSCRGSGQVVCRSCFSGDPWDLEAVRARALRRPD